MEKAAGSNRLTQAPAEGRVPNRNPGFGPAFSRAQGFSAVPAVNAGVVVCLFFKREVPKGHFLGGGGGKQVSSSLDFIFPYLHTNGQKDQR